MTKEIEFRDLFHVGSDANCSIAYANIILCHGKWNVRYNGRYQHKREREREGLCTVTHTQSTHTARGLAALHLRTFAHTQHVTQPTAAIFYLAFHTAHCKASDLSSLILSYGTSEQNKTEEKTRDQPMK
jgi:hypothetical protein